MLADPRSLTAVLSSRAISSCRSLRCDAVTTFPSPSPPLWVREEACSRGDEAPRSRVLPAQKCGWAGDYREGLSCSSLATIQLGSKSRTTWSPVPDVTGAGESSPVCGSTKLTPAAIRV